MKLSKTQASILRRMGEGERFEYVGPPIDRYFWPEESQGVNRRSAEVLKANGLIRVYYEAWWGDMYHITPAGRKYLEEHDGTTHIAD